MASNRHDYYNRENFPTFVCHHGLNWDIYKNGRGVCAAIPSPAGEAAGCSATQFGDMEYVESVMKGKLAGGATSGGALHK